MTDVSGVAVKNDERGRGREERSRLLDEDEVETDVVARLHEDVFVRQTEDGGRVDEVTRVARLLRMVEKIVLQVVEETCNATPRKNITFVTIPSSQFDSISDNGNSTSISTTIFLNHIDR